MLITHTLLVFYTPRHNPNYAANDSVWKAQNKYIPARKVKKDKLQMNQNSNSQGNLVVLLIPYFFSTKKSDVCPARIQPSLKKTFKRCGVITLGYFAQCKANSIPPPPPPPARTVSLHWFATRTPTVFLHPNAKRPFTDSSPFFKQFFGMADQFHRHR